jgi:hypothetical protein
VTFIATVTGNDGTVGGTVEFKDGTNVIAGCAAVAIASGTAACSTSALAAGVRTITATYSGSLVYSGSNAALNEVVTSGASPITGNPTPVDFGGQSINTTSPSQAITITNTSGGSVAITSVVAPPGFAVTHNCPATLGAGAQCTANATFTPTTQGAISGPLAIVHAGTGPAIVPLAGTGERSLVTHFYRAILRRAPDGPGKAFWEAEAARLQSIGANINEAWYALAQFFFFSAEYATFNRDNTGFVTDLYVTFFNRQPDGGGLNFWVAELASGVPREVVLAAFMFSTEFRNFTAAIFGNTAAAAEIDTVMDFYRGLLARTPDDGGFNAWVSNFRTAQCNASPGAAVNSMVEAISSGFALSGEYTGKNRTNAQYVGDLYNAFLRRGGDLGGVNFWVNDLNMGTRTRENVRQNFVASPEFQARVAAIVNQGCLP